MGKKIFISGATGFQGGAIVREIIAKGNNVTSLTSSEEKVVSKTNLEILKGSFENKESIKEALKNVEAAVFTIPLVFDVEKAKEYTSNFVEAAKEENVPLVVYNASFDLPTEETGFLALDMKIEIKNILDASKLNVITLVPDIYIDNIAAPWSIPVLHEHSIVPYPVKSEKKLPWISHNDLAKYVSSAVDKPALAGEVLPIGGNLLTGEEISEVISKELGKPLNFVSVTPNDFEQQISPAFGELAGREISNLYRYVESNRETLTQKAFLDSQEKLGVTPESLEDWAKSVNWNLS